MPQQNPSFTSHLAPCSTVPQLNLAPDPRSFNLQDKLIADGCLPQLMEQARHSQRAAWDHLHALCYKNKVRPGSGLGFGVFQGHSKAEHSLLLPGTICIRSTTRTRCDRDQAQGFESQTKATTIHAHTAAADVMQCCDNNSRTQCSC